MADIVNNNGQNANDTSNLNAGMSTAGQAASNMLTNVGNANPIPNKNATSGQYNNFSNYQQANKNSGQRLTNLLSSNVQQQGNAVQDTVDTSKDVTTAIGAENKRISDDLSKLSGAVDQTKQGNYSGFNQFLNGDPSNPANAGLTTNMQQLAQGQTQGAQLQQQSNDIFNQANTQMQGLQTNQSLGGTEAGRQQLLANILGNAGNYGQGANTLDQALISGNTDRLNGLLGTLNNTTQNAQNSIGTAQSGIATGLTGLAQNASAGQQQALDLSKLGLGNLDTSLSTQAQAAEQKRQQDQLDILNQFNTEGFKQGTANQLGIGQGTVLFNQLQGNGQNYNIADASKLGTFNNSPYLALNQAQVNKANVIDNPELSAYSSLQRMLGADPNSFAYKNVGTVDPAYNLNAQQFDKDLAAKYQNAADSAAKDVVGGYGEQEYHHGLFNATSDTARASVNRNVNQMIDPNAIRAAGQNFGALATPQNVDVSGDVHNGKLRDVTDVNQAVNNISLGHMAESGARGAAIGAAGGPLGALAGGIVGAATNLIVPIGAAINSGWDSLTGNNNVSSSQADAQQKAVANFQQNWQNYLKNRGYTDTAKIVPDSMEQNKGFNVG